MAFSLKDYSGFEKIGEGGMGKVYLATQISLDRRVVIKEIAAELLTDPALVQRFENEAKSAASLDHDNVIRVYDFGEDSGFFYIAMEYIDGPDLEQLLSQEQFPKVIGLMAVLQALKGLNYAHRHGVAHGDVKPDNILVSSSGRVKITDFGLSYFNAQSADFPVAETVFLTPAYMPPEQANKVEGQEIEKEVFSETIPAYLRPRTISPPAPNGPPEGMPDGMPSGTETGGPDIRRDIWSVGVLLYRVLSGKFPFSGEDISGLAQSIEHKSATPISEIVPTMPENLAARIDSCLIKEPRDRLPTLEPLIESLENFFFDIGIRDIEKEIGKYLADGKTSIAELEKLLSGYHIRVSEEYLADGDESKSALHFEEAEKINAAAGNTRKNGGLRKLTPSRNSKTVRVPAINHHNRGPIRKHRVLKALSQVAAIILIASLGAAGSYALVRKILENSNRQVDPATNPVGMVGAPLSSVAAALGDTGETLYTFIDPVPVSVDTMQDMVRKDSAGKNRNPAPEDVRPARKPAPRTGVLKITVTPIPAQVFVDGDENISQEELTSGLLLNPGTHVITAVADGYEPYQDWVRIEKDKLQNISIELKPLGKTGSILDIYCYPQASVHVDGIARGFTPKTVSVSEGRHFVMIHRDGYEPYSEPVEVTPRKPVRLQVRLEKQE